MGNRANIKFKESKENSFYLYMHWDGFSLPYVLQSALARKERWDDSQYLSRIIFCEMVKDDIGGETGYGISVEMGDNGNPIIEVDVEDQTVTIDEKTWTFPEYIELSRTDMRSAYGD